MTDANAHINADTALIVKTGKGTYRPLYHRTRRCCCMGETAGRIRVKRIEILHLMGKRQCLHCYNGACNACK